MEILVLICENDTEKNPSEIFPKVRFFLYFIRSNGKWFLY